MNIQEFTDRTGFYPSMELYAVIEQAYMEQSADKDAFCKAYKENTDGLAEKIRNATDSCHFDAAELTAKELTKRDEKIKRLSKQLEREQEWRPKGHASNMTDADYAELAESGKALTDRGAKELIFKELGFDFDKIEIVHEIPTYEINRHGQLRQTDTISRPPVYCSTDWHYIRFDVCGRFYELINGELSPFYD